MSLIEARGLGLTIAGNAILSDVDFSLTKGEIITVVGPNGSGKSTLLRLLIGAERPTSGTILRTTGLRIGYVPQRLHIDPTLPLTAARFLTLPHRPEPDRLTHVIAETGISDLTGRMLATLSGGQFQRVLLARALLSEPDLLVLDEPTQGLDQPAVAEFYQLIERVRTEWGCAVLMVSHDLHVVMSASDRVICLNGHVCCQGTPHVVRAAPEYRALFGHGTAGALALYQHEHEHDHNHDHEGCDHA
ncbi:metal ABC transporter ATP-binding protein [Halovulum sp. GXIMD14793]